MPECGHLMGHLAIPNKDGVLTYLDPPLEEVTLYLEGTVE